jgi:cation diffusion facilitator CzcD-associated flavoprotein CzcO
VTTDRGDALSARWLIMATGCLSTPNPAPITTASTSPDIGARSNLDPSATLASQVS